MRKLLLYLSLLFYVGLHAQVGIGTNEPDASSALEISFTDKGLLIPRLSFTERTDISLPATGLLVYETNTNGFWYYNSAQWIAISGSVGWSLEGNASTDPNGHFIGTTDDNPLSFRINNGRVGHLDNQGNVFWGLASGVLNTGMENTGVGEGALSNNATGQNNTAIGYQALFSNTTGNYNTANGTQALNNNTIGNDNTANGYRALYNNIDGNSNTASGAEALYYNTTGNLNTVSGAQALYSNTTGENNTANGYQALYYNTTGNLNTANGAEALYNNTTGENNTASGAEALYSNTIGENNTAEGDQALYFNIGNNNTASGYQALYSNAAGEDNTANGYQALYSNMGNNNTANGSQALNKNTTGENNTASGYNALIENTSGDSNIAIGAEALGSNTDGHHNVAVGYHSLLRNTSGYNNTAIGSESDVGSDNLENATAIGYGAVVDASDKVRIGNAAVTVVEGQVAWSTPSDARFKYNVQNNVPGLEFITKLKPATYYFDTEKLAEFTTTGVIGSSWAPAEGKVLETGFLAQEVEKIAQEKGYDFDGINKPENDRGKYTLAYSQFVVPLVKAVQERQEIIETQNDKINSLEARNEDLLVLLQAQQAQIESISHSLEALLPKAN